MLPRLSSSYHIHTTIKIRSEFRNVGDAAYAMSHLSAEACTQRLAAGRGFACSSNRCRPTQPEHGTGSGPACYKLAIQPVHMQRTVKCSELRREGGRGQRARGAISP